MERVWNENNYERSWRRFGGASLGRIYPDGSVWFDDARLSEEPSNPFKLNDKVKVIFRGANEPYYEYNLRVNYKEVMNAVANAK